MGTEERNANEPDSNRNTVKAVETSITIIESLKQQKSAGLTEVANETGLSKSNIHKHLTTLRKEGFVVKEGDEYRLSLQYLDFGSEARLWYPGTQLIKPRITELAQKTGEVAQFMIEERGWSVIVYKETGHQGVSIRTRPGTHLQMHQTASGKAMLSYMPDSKVEKILDRHGLEAATENTITDEAEFFKELERTRERGYAINKGESTRGLQAVSAPIRKMNDDVLGACSVSGPAHRMKGRTTEKEIPELLLSIVNEFELNIAHS